MKQNEGASVRSLVPSGCSAPREGPSGQDGDARTKPAAASGHTWRPGRRRPRSLRLLLSRSCVSEQLESYRKAGELKQTALTSHPTSPITDIGRVGGMLATVNRLILIQVGIKVCTLSTFPSFYIRVCDLLFRDPILAPPVTCGCPVSLGRSWLWHFRRCPLFSRALAVLRFPCPVTGLPTCNHFSS